ncbi:Dynein light chain roadblock-type 2 [Hymenolepis weldensis]
MHILSTQCAAVPIRTTMEKALTVHYCALTQQLVSKSRAGVRDGDPTNDLTFLRIRSKKNEIMIAPGMYLPSIISTYLF